LRRKTHDRVARELAFMLHLDERLVLLGSRLPDLDNVIGRHRKTLHNPFVLAGTTFHPAVFVGCASHLLVDLFPTKIERLISTVKRLKETLK